MRTNAVTTSQYTWNGADVRPGFCQLPGVGKPYGLGFKTRLRDSLGENTGFRSNQMSDGFIVFLTPSKWWKFVWIQFLQLWLQRMEVTLYYSSKHGKLSSYPSQTWNFESWQVASKKILLILYLICVCDMSWCATCHCIFLSGSAFAA